MEKQTATLYRNLSEGVKKRLLLPEDQFVDTYLNTLETHKNTDFYESIFLYNSEHFAKFQKKPSLAGFDGVITNKIVFDFDSKENIELARQDAVDLCFELIDPAIYGFEEKALKIYFSGSKGFHIEIGLPEGVYITQPEFESIIMSLGSQYKTFDPRVKDSQRIFRLPLSKHQVTGNYKIPLTFEEFTSLDTEEIIKLASSEYNQDVMMDKLTTQFVNTKFDIKKLLSNIQLSSKAEIPAHVGEADYDLQFMTKPDMSRKPKHISAAKFALMEGYFDEGERNHACMILCATYRNFGYDKEIAYNMLKATLRKRAERLNLKDYDKHELWNTIVEPIYRDTWRGGTYSEREDALINKTVAKYKLKTELQEKETLSITEISEKFKTFADNIDKNIVKTGIPLLDEKVLITSGMMVGLLGAPSSGKTSHSISLLEHQSNHNIGALMVSADMAEPLLYARLMQRYCGISFKVILDEIKLKPYKMWNKKIKDAWDQVLLNFKNVGFSFQSGPSVEDIARRIEEQEQLTGAPVKMLVVDYLEKIRCQITDPTHASGFNASRLSDLTRDKAMATILLLQPQKSAGDPSDELLSMRKVKGASVIEQDCRVILTTWRPGFNPDCKGRNEDDVFSSVAIVKNNMGETNRIDFRFDGATGLLRALTLEDEQMLNEVKARAQMRKMANFKASEGIYQMPEKSNRNYTSQEPPHKPKHRALPTGYEKENKDIY